MIKSVKIFSKYCESSNDLSRLNDFRIILLLIILLIFDCEIFFISTSVSLYVRDDLSLSLWLKRIQDRWFFYDNWEDNVVSI